MTLDVDAVRSSRSSSMSHKIERSRGSCVYGGGGRGGGVRGAFRQLRQLCISAAKKRAKGPDESAPVFMEHGRHSQLVCTNAKAARASIPHRSGG
jgi:hypothetical protein